MRQQISERAWEEMLSEMGRRQRREEQRKLADCADYLREAGAGNVEQKGRTVLFCLPGQEYALYGLEVEGSIWKLFRKTNCSHRPVLKEIFPVKHLSRGKLVTEVLRMNRTARLLEYEDGGNSKCQNMQATV